MSSSGHHASLPNDDAVACLVVERWMRLQGDCDGE